jgi:hypothetical protein
MRVDSTGYIGISTTTPSANLEVGNTVGGLPPATGSTSTQTSLRVSSVTASDLDMGVNGASPYQSWIQTRNKTNAAIFYSLLLNPNGGNVGIGTTVPTAPLHVVGLLAFANNAAAVAGGLTPGAFYHTGADPDAVCVVH